MYFEGISFQKFTKSVLDAVLFVQRTYVRFWIFVKSEFSLYGANLGPSNSFQLDFSVPAMIIEDNLSNFLISSSHC